MKYDDDDDFSIGNAMVYLLIVLVILYSTFGFWGYNREISEEYQVTCNDIYSLNTATEVSGTFVLGFGGVGSDIIYTCYTKDDNGLYRLSTYNAARTPIRLDDSQNPKVVKVMRTITDTPCTIFGGTKESYESDTGKRIIVVPSNTIRREYKVN